MIFYCFYSVLLHTANEVLATCSISARNFSGLCEDIHGSSASFSPPHPTMCFTIDMGKDLAIVGHTLYRKYQVHTGLGKVAVCKQPRSE